MNIYGWNIINSILSIGTYINTSIILLPTILLSLLSSTLFRTFQSFCIMNSCCTHPTSTGLAGISFTALVMHSATSCPVALWISIKNIFGLCSSFNFNEFQRQQLKEIWPYMWSIILYQCVYYPIYSLSNVFCPKVYLNIDVKMDGSFGPPFRWMKSISSTQCLPVVYEAWSYLWYMMILFQFDTQRITTMNISFGWCKTLLLSFWQCTRLNLLWVAFLLAFPISLPPEFCLRISSQSSQPTVT